MNKLIRLLNTAFCWYKKNIYTVSQEKNLIKKNRGSKFMLFKKVCLSGLLLIPLGATATPPMIENAKLPRTGETLELTVAVPAVPVYPVTNATVKSEVWEFTYSEIMQEQNTVAEPAGATSVYPPVSELMESKSVREFSSLRASKKQKKKRADFMHVLYKEKLKPFLNSKSDNLPSWEDFNSIIDSLPNNESLGNDVRDIVYKLLEKEVLNTSNYFNLIEVLSIDNFCNSKQFNFMKSVFNLYDAGLLKPEKCGFNILDNCYSSMDIILKFITGDLLTREMLNLIYEKKDKHNECFIAHTIFFYLLNHDNKSNSKLLTKENIVRVLKGVMDIEVSQESLKKFIDIPLNQEFFNDLLNAIEKNTLSELINKY
ncbi:MAG: hypothetical protein OXC48_09320 [Endozoicomonadaceae bacterium]|nr:hypothetical protein [Endozoicomonadaceae bacterium]